ncbi:MULTISPECIES: hypothetical protein [unclassified Amycolatopsis]|uniref:hypothetical protein n=1 Tax=unclassified Amycolatopsis TaxID=2618356 RepID=UPI00106E320E|nr:MULTISPECIES: hypothetical protein [unclassified Amycolatopsis]
MDSVTLPRPVLYALRQASLPGVATEMLTGASRPLTFPTGFGDVLAWLWTTDSNSAVIYLAELMKQLRERHPLAKTVSPPFRFDELLTAARECLPDDFAHAELLIQYTRTALGDFYGGSEN